MKTCLTILMSLAFATVAVRGQDLPSYQSTVSGQSPYYYNHLDNSLVPSAGSGTLVSTATGTGFTNDYYGNANDSAFFTTTTAQLADATGNDIIANSGTTANSIGSLTLLFYTPNTNNASSRYIFSDGDVANPGGSTNGQQFALEQVNQGLTLKAGNKSIVTPWTVTAGTWYYFATTWNFTGANSNAFGINFYLGVAGQSSGSLLSSNTQRGGTGNISSVAVLGNGGTFTLSSIQSDASGGYQVNGVPGGVDELATWTTQLTAAQITSQYSALILVPEPSTLVLCGSALVGLCAAVRRRRASKK